MDDRYPILRYFSSDHLNDDLKEVSEQFEELAHQMVADLPHGPEVSAGLRKLLEAKDCFVRARIP